MKSVFRFLGLGLMAGTFTVVGSTNSFAQDPCTEVEAKQALYKKFTDNFDKSIELRKTAVTAAKEYLEKYGSCAEDKQQVDYFKTYIPAAEEQIKTAEGAAAAAAARTALFKRFNSAMDSKTWDEVYASGKEIVAKEGDSVIGNDVTLVLGSIGLDESYKNNDKYNADTVRYAQMSIEKLEANKQFKDFGVIVNKTNYSYKNDKFPDTKANALGWMNFTIGYIKFFREKNKKDALPYLYKASQLNSFVKNKPEVYAGIGQYYLDEAVRLDNERTEKLKVAKNVDTDETKAIYALQKGYADRGIDAYARAYKLIGTTPAEKAYKDNVYTILKGAYEFRNNGKIEGLDAYIASVTSKPMPNPTTEVTPVVEVAPATTTSTNNTSSTAAPTTVPVNNTAKAVTAETPANSTTAKPAATAAVKPTKAPAKKPAPKKKGTR